MKKCTIENSDWMELEMGSRISRILMGVPMYEQVMGEEHAISVITRKMVSSGGASLCGYHFLNRQSCDTCTNTKKDEHAH